MKKFFTLLLLCVVTISAHCQEAQSTNYSFLDKCLVEIGAKAGMRNKGTAPLSGNINLGYNFTPRFYAFVKAEGVIGLYNKDGEKTYTRSQDLGGGIGIKLLSPKTSKESLDLRFSVANSIGNATWKHTSYDANIIWYQNSHKKRCVPYIGIGFQHINSHTAGFANYNGVYVTVGMRF